MEGYLVHFCCSQHLKLAKNIKNEIYIKFPRCWTCWIYPFIELNYIRNVFEHKNGCPRYVIEKTINSIGEGLLSEKDNRKHILLQLPYKGLTGEKLIRSLNKLITDSFPNELNARILFKGTTLSSHFNLKDKTNKEHIHS